MICRFCGKDAGEGSMGGPSVCAMCDCGFTVDSDGTMRKWSFDDIQYKVLMGKVLPFKDEDKCICEGFGPCPAQTHGD